MMDGRPNMQITQKGLKDRGWTKILIDNFAPECEKKKLPRNRFCLLYKLADIELIEQSKSFKAFQEKASKRSQAAKIAAETKQKNNQPMFDQLIEKINAVELPQRDIQYWYKAVKYEHEAYDADERVLNRWVFNRFRHEYFPYDSQFEDTKGLVGKGQHIEAVREAIGKVTLRYYPVLETAVKEYLYNK